uniref:Uncharacterized protein n=1 Tax=Picea sitchensis TaxID=3332 RepID=B8LNH7_PICSI|nr:unknown [Picea sitchensis]
MIPFVSLSWQVEITIVVACSYPIAGGWWTIRGVVV